MTEAVTVVVDWAFTEPSVLRVGAVVDMVGVVGGTTLGGGAASELPDVLGTGTSGSEIGRTDSFAGSQIEAGV